VVCVKEVKEVGEETGRGEECEKWERNGEKIIRGKKKIG
jgi:hypothetical protein